MTAAEELTELLVGVWDNRVPELVVRDWLMDKGLHDVAAKLCHRRTELRLRLMVRCPSCDHRGLANIVTKGDETTPVGSVVVWSIIRFPPRELETIKMKCPLCQGRRWSIRPSIVKKLEGKR